MRKIFLDCGAHCGCSRRKFLAEFKDANEYEIFSFEADPALNAYCDDLINKAVWVEDTTKTFYKFWVDGGSSLLKKRADILQATKPNYYDREEITVECFDLDKFIKENFDKSDYIILKLDVEGAEYEILPHLIKNGSIEYLNQLFIEWHDVRIGIPPAITYNLTYQINNVHNIPVKIWDAMDAKYCPIFVHPDRKKRNAWR